MWSRYIGAHEVAALVIAVLPFVPVGPAFAQPSPEQVDAIRQSCRSDFISHCAGVQPGGREALECLASHAPQLSSACADAVTAVAPKPAETPAPAAAAAAAPDQSPQEQLAAVSKVCTLSDFTAHCYFIAPSNPELVLCLKANAADLSPACHTVVSGLAATAPSAVAAPSRVVPPPPMSSPPPAPVAAPSPPAPVPPPPAAVAAPRKPTQQEISAIRAACRSDFISHCSGVQPGGPQALQCLERNKAQASSRCRTALAAIAGAAPSVAAPAESATAAPAAPAESFPVRRLRLREELAILRMCIDETRSLCGDVPPGGGRIITCLAQNASQLSPQCRAAMAQARN
jgi:hypothetical protein